MVQNRIDHVVKHADKMTYHFEAEYTQLVHMCGLTTFQAVIRYFSNSNFYLDRLLIQLRVLNPRTFIEFSLLSRTNFYSLCLT